MIIDDLMCGPQYIYVDDVAAACLLLMQNYNDDTPINFGGAGCVSIGDLAVKIKDIVGFKGEIWLNANKPDGMPMKALDSTTLLKMGWSSATGLDVSLCKTYEWFKAICRSHSRGQETMSSLVH